MTKILCTGGCGFIGSHLVERLVKKESNQVFVLDNLSIGNRDNLKGINVGSFDSYNELPLLLANHGSMDVIFHLGMPSSSPMYKADPSLVGETIGEAVQLFEYAKTCNSKVIIASTSSLYNGYKAPFSELNNLPIPFDFYTETRYAIERLARTYNSLYGMKAIILRLFSVYGPREEHKGKYANIVSQFLWEMRKGNAPVIYGDGSQGRDFIHVDDVVEAFVLASKYDSDKVDIFNVGTGKFATFNDVVGLLNDALNTKIAPVYKPNPIKNYIRDTLADTSKSERVLGFKAKIGLKEGIERLVRVQEE